MSRKWDAREAGRDVARNTIKKLSKPPDFFLLFSTIHYERHGGFQEFLNGVWDVLPKGTPLIGGTIAGFINNYGCYCRGATAIAISYPRMDIVISTAENTRKNPKRAAEKCANKIKKSLGNKYGGNVLFDVISGPTKPQFFGRSLPVVIRGGFISKLGPKYLEIASKLLQKANGLEEEVIKNLETFLPDYIFFGSSSSDSNDLVENYQFFDKNISEHSIVAMGLNTDLKFDLAHSHGLQSTGVKFKVTKTAFNSRIIKELDGKPASDTFFGKVGISKDYLDGRILRTTFFYPLGFKSDDGYICPDTIGAIIKDSIAFNHSVANNEIELLTTSGKMLISAVDEAIKNLKITKPKVGFMISCLARLETLGVNIFKERDVLIDYFKNVPFLLIYASGENIKFPNKDAHHFNESFNIFVFSDEN